MNSSRKQYIGLIFYFALFSVSSYAQPFESVRSEIGKIISSKDATVGVGVIGLNPGDTLSFNGDRQFPMQSVFKFHIAVVVLSEIDKGKFSLVQKVNIDTSELLPGLYSPLREKYPNGASLSIRELLEYMVSQSDNVGCDKLLKLLGGPKVVEQYFHRHGFDQVSIKINEETMQGNWDLQYQNWTTPRSANRVLQSFYANDRKLLSAGSHKILWQLMKQTTTGANRLKGQLPRGTVVAHKTGWSGTNQEGVTAAVNNIGIVFLPNGKHFVISVFVSNSKEDMQVNEAIIASICKVVWNHYVK